MQHDFFQNALTSFIYDLNSRLKHFSNSINDSKFPIMIMNTGDEVYLANMQEDSKDKVRLYDRIPRMILSIGGADIKTDQLSNPNNFGKLSDNSTGFNNTKVATVRRIPISFVVNSKVYFSNMLQYLSFIEVFLSTTFRVSSFNFKHSGAVHYGSYTSSNSFDGNPNFGLRHDSEKRRIELDITFELELQFPAYDYYGARNGDDMLDATDVIKSFVHRTETQNDPKQIVHIPQDCC